ncbi:hypothetical protein [Xanthomonas sp. 3058]|uniref:hypothetical protein n=1 Tax=Xanthomonas sp. 3058 TaxID=3035314 RepID=UPI0016200F72|nr:hypothetical protein [Xanthomonas sp. 3058]
MEKAVSVTPTEPRVQAMASKTAKTRMAGARPHAAALRDAEAIRTSSKKSSPGGGDWAGRALPLKMAASGGNQGPLATALGKDGQRLKMEINKAA